MRTVLLGTEEDKTQSLEIIRKSGAKPIDAVGVTDLPRLVSLIKRCDALVTGDSAPMHIAAATDIPFVALFGPTDPKKHLPPSRKQKTVWKNLKCSPCYSPSCIRGHKCMNNIKAEEVFEELVKLL